MTVDKRKSERRNEGAIRQGSGWRLKTHLWKILERRKMKKRESKRKESGKEQGCNATRAHIRGYKSCNGTQTEKSPEI